VAAPRAVLAVGYDPNDPARRRRLLVCVKNNLPAFPPALAFSIGDRGLAWEPAPVTVGIDPDALLGTAQLPESAEGRAELTAAMAFLEKLLADAPGPSAEVKKAARANGISERTLWRA